MQTLRLIVMALALTAPARADLSPRSDAPVAALFGGGGASGSARYDATGSFAGFAASAEHEHPITVEPPGPGKDIILLPSAAGSVTIPVATLLANDLDLENASSGIVLLSGATLHGGTVTLANGIITYTPPAVPPPAGVDSFYYQVTNEIGFGSLGTVALALESAASRAVAARRFPNGMLMTFAGAPDRLYQLQFRSDFSPNTPWRSYPSESEPFIQRANAEGAFEFTGGIELRQGFYRGVDLQSLSFLPPVLRSGDRLAMNFRGQPLALHKLQFRASFSPETPWTDYPSTGQPLLQRASRDGEYTLSAVIAGNAGFFRAVPAEP